MWVRWSVEKAHQIKEDTQNVSVIVREAEINTEDKKKKANPKV